MIHALWGEHPALRCPGEGLQSRDEEGHLYAWEKGKAQGSTPHIAIPLAKPCPALGTMLGRDSGRRALLLLQPRAAEVGGSC